MKYVQCRRCPNEVPVKSAWRKRELYSRGDGGSLGRVKLMVSLNHFICDDCMRQLENEQRGVSTGQGTIL